MAKKTYEEKLHVSTGLPKIEDVSRDELTVRRFGGSRMLIAAPLEYDAVMKMIPPGKLITSNEIRAYLAKRHDADFTCHLTAGIFINIVANASQERENAGSSDITPYWRTLKKDGELNEKYPGGVDQQKFLLETEGHEVAAKGKRYFVKDYEKMLFDLKDE